MTEIAELYGDALFAHDHDLEAVRLDAMSRMHDPATQARLSAITRPGMRCLDVGAGLGRVSGWLADQVAPGEVTALDKDVRLLNALPDVFPTVQVVAADISDNSLDLGSFDLIHARMVLMHLRNRREVFARLASWLKPGGWLVLADAIQSTMVSPPENAFRRLMELHWATLERSIGTDRTWALNYPDLLRGAGFKDVGVELYHPPVSPDSAAGRFWALNFGHLRERILADGLVDEDLFEQAVGVMNEPDFTELGMGLVTAWGRKP
ncbi:class I SAM-dependent methyltransferase [Actinocrispum sp. NPDC049592]|uniref:class I SAM-dependent methyltransferase n=1 Tax=Actinocrispum sp. NPDC049592 TaxID=3154835 RepID=UPI0034135CF8